MAEKKKLSPKQQRFVKEYLVDLNATGAAKRAGYSDPSYGRQLLTFPNVSEAIAKEREKLAKRTEITQERVLEEYAKIAFLDPSELFNSDGTLKPIDKLDPKVVAAIGGIEILQTKLGDYVKKIKLIDKKGALDSIAKHLGMFIERHEHTGKDGTPLTFVMNLGGPCQKQGK